MLIGSRFLHTVNKKQLNEVRKTILFESVD